MSKTRTVLICDQIHRELQALQLVKDGLEKIANHSVTIIGSLADTSRMYYLLGKIKPQIVFISQIQENVTRELAKYIKESGATLCVLPVEITYAKKNFDWYYSSKMKYSSLVDVFFAPGREMKKDLLRVTDLKEDQIVVVGSPKIDAYKLKTVKQALSRNSFLKKHNIRPGRKNVFIYTTFFARSQEYIDKDKSFDGNRKRVNHFYSAFKKTKRRYLVDIPVLAKKFPEYNFVLKPHPLESNHAYKKIVGENLYLVRGESLANTLSSVDLAIHWNSTVSTECWVNNIKTIQYSPLKSFNDLLSEFKIGNPVITDLDSLVKKIQDYMREAMEKKYLKNQDTYLKNWFYIIDGKSGERIAKYVDNKITVSPTVNYEKRHTIFMDIFVFLEKLFGYKLTRNVGKILFRNYNWKYSLQNYLLVS